MGFVDKIAKRFAKTASTEATETMKTEIRNTAVNALPLVMGVGFVILWLKVFKTTSAVKSVASVARPLVPTLTTMSITTNNFFFDEVVKRELLPNILTSIEGGIR